MRIVPAGGEVLTIWTAGKYMIGEICGYYNLYKNGEKLGLYHSLKQAQARADQDARRTCRVNRMQ